MLASLRTAAVLTVSFDKATVQQIAGQTGWRCCSHTLKLQAQHAECLWTGNDPTATRLYAQCDSLHHYWTAVQLTLCCNEVADAQAKRALPCANSSSGAA
eukprot:3672-Heterococcus_DN1.PRE.6